MNAARLAVCLALAAGNAAAAGPPAKSEDATKLEPIIVVPEADPYEAGLAHVRKSLPCFGSCEGEIIKARESVTERAVRYFLLPAEPKEPTEFEKDRAQQFCSSAGPGMDYYCSP